MGDFAGMSANSGRAMATDPRSSFGTAALVASTESEPDVSFVWAGLKRVIDLAGGLVLCIVLSPVLLIILSLIALGGGAPIFGQQRIGRSGRIFTCYKFRTMIPNAETVLKEVLRNNPEMEVEWKRDEKLRCDPRVTRVGAFLRKTSLDELPQLLNVLKGDMSLVGPKAGI